MFSGRLSTLGLTLANTDIVNEAGVVVAQMLRRITNKLDIGAELVYQYGKQVPGELLLHFALFSCLFSMNIEFYQVMCSSWRFVQLRQMLQAIFIYRLNCSMFFWIVPISRRSDHRAVVRGSLHGHQLDGGCDPRNDRPPPHLPPQADREHSVRSGVREQPEHWRGECFPVLFL